jgi:hypothetical protein
MRRALVVILVACGVGCGGPALRQAGEPCTSSSECDSGLVCDFGQSPAVCATQSSVADAPPGMADADPTIPDAPPGAPDADPCDGVDCSGMTDQCNTGVCVDGACMQDPLPNTTPCSDGLFCTGTETCNAGACDVSTGNPCAGHNVGPSCDDSCSEALDNCTAPDVATTPCNENADGTTGACDGTAIEPNCAGD